MTVLDPLYTRPRLLGEAPRAGQRCDRCHNRFRALDKVWRITSVQGIVVYTYLPGRIVCDACMTRSLERLNRHARQCDHRCPNYPCQSVRLVESAA